MSGKIFDLTPESEGPRRAARQPASWYGGSGVVGDTYMRRALEQAALDALRGAEWVVRRRAAAGQEGGEDALTLALAQPRREFDRAEWAATVRRVAMDRAAGTAYLARKREERLARRAAEAAAASEQPAASTSAADVVQTQAEVGREGGALSPALSGRIQAKRGGGQPLEATVRRGMEGVFQVNFSGVRVHVDGEADLLNRGVAAIAFTVGSDIFFRAGYYQPHSAAGQHLLAHELTHVVQQSRGTLASGGGSGNGGGTMTVGAADDRHEVDAEETAHRVTAALQRRALLAQATTPGAGMAHQHEPAVALTPAAPGVARLDVQRAWWNPWDDAVGAWHALKGAAKAAWHAVVAKADELARGTPGYALLCDLLGKDPITGAHVAGGATAVVRDLLHLVPGGDKLFTDLKRSGALAKTFTWITRHTRGLFPSLATIKDLFKHALNNLSLDDIKDPVGAAHKVLGVFTPYLHRLLNFAWEAVRQTSEFILEGVLSAAGPFGRHALAILSRAGDVFALIVKDPMTFAKNLVHALHDGVTAFFRHIWEHLKNGVTTWLLGATHLTLPPRLDLAGGIALVFEAAGLGYGALHQKLERRLGATRVAELERGAVGGYALLRTLKDGGQGALVKQLVGYVKHLDVLGTLQGWAVQTIAAVVVPKLLALASPVGDIIVGIQTVYQAVEFFLTNAGHLADLANAVFDAIVDIAHDKVRTAANVIEGTLERGVPMLLGFVASLFGLGKVSEDLKDVIKKLRSKVDEAMDRLVAAISAATAHLPRGRNHGHNVVEGGQSGADTETFQQVPVSGDKDDNGQPHMHHLWVEMRGSEPIVLIASSPADVRQVLQTLQLEAAENLYGLPSYWQVDRSLNQAGRQLSRGIARMRQHLSASTRQHSRSGGATAHHLSGHSGLSRSQMRSLRPIVTQTLDDIRDALEIVYPALAKVRGGAEPRVGLHPIPTNGSKRESHHVPAAHVANALHDLYADVHTDLKKRNRSGASFDELRAALAARVRLLKPFRRVKGENLDGNGLSAILLSVEAHRTSDLSNAVHQAGFASAIERGILHSLRHDEERVVVRNDKNQLFTNPQDPAWQGFVKGVYHLEQEQATPNYLPNKGLVGAYEDRSGIAGVAHEIDQATNGRSEVRAARGIRNRINRLVPDLFRQALGNALTAVREALRYSLRDGPHDKHDGILKALDRRARRNWEHLIANV